MWRAVVVAFGFAFLLTPAPAIAASDTAGAQIDKRGPSKAMTLHSDELIDDQANGQVIARGDVQVNYMNYDLLTDTLTYDRKSQTLIATGHVRIREPDGGVVAAEIITLSDDFRDGFIHSYEMAKGRRPN